MPSELVTAGRSTGRPWLKKTFQIGKLIIHPKDPNIVYVGALGRLYGPNEERGLYKTVDGGKTWKKILHVDNDTGVIEMKMHPTKPDELLVATDMAEVSRERRSARLMRQSRGRSLEVMRSKPPDC